MITHVAIIYQGVTYSLPKPYRHHDVIRDIVVRTGGPVGLNQQGFLTDKGLFLDRRKALVHAYVFRQVTDPAKIRGGQLYSEDLW